MSRKNRELPTSKIYGTVSWIADELIGIRTVDQGLSRRLTMGAPQKSQSLLDGIHESNRCSDLQARVFNKYLGAAR